MTTSTVLHLTRDSGRAMLGGNPEAVTEINNSQKGTATQGSLATNPDGSGTETQVVFGVVAPKALAYAQDTRLGRLGQRTERVHGTWERVGVKVDLLAGPKSECDICGCGNIARDIGYLPNGQLICQSCHDEAGTTMGFKAARGPQPKVELGVPNKIRRAIFERDGYRCRYCGGFKGGLAIDHVMPRSRGGAHTADNLVTSCTSCNSRKHDRTPEEAGMPMMPLGGQA